MKRTIAVASTVVGVAAFAYTLAAIGAGTIEQALARVGWGFAVILLMSSAREFAKSAAWAQTFTGPDRLSLAAAFRARLAGEALSTLLPMGFVVGEPTKAQYVDDRMPFATAFSGLILEFAFYSASLCLVAVAAAFVFAPNKGVLIAVIVALALVPLLPPVRRAFAPVRRFVIDWPQRAWTIAALEAAYHALGCAEAYVILRCLDPAGATWSAAVAFEAINRGVTMVFKMIPMRIGIDEASAAFLAARLSISPSTGVMVALVRKLRVFFWTALGLLAVALRAFRRWAPARIRGGDRFDEIPTNARITTARSLP
jgi:hypothetical protein